MAGSTQQGTPAPSLAEWHRVWQLWDAATLDMIPRDDITAQPLQLRHPFIFYVGHLPAFTDARLARVLQQQLIQPAHFAVMFARGIDPDLEDPTQCHSHSPVPHQWPQLSVILQYRDDVRQRIKSVYKQYSSSNGSRATDAAAVAGAVAVPADLVAVAAMPVEVQHVLWMCYEHEAMHLETFMYMLVQYDRVKPPPVQLLQQDANRIAPLSNVTVSPDASQQQQQQLGRHQLPDMQKLVLGSELSTNGRAGKGLLPLPAAATWVHLPGRHVTMGFDAADAVRAFSKSSGPLAVDMPASLTAAAAGRCLAPAGPDVAEDQNSSAAAAAAAGPCRFGWDNESPARTEYVDSCMMQHRPVCVLEYLWFLAHHVCKHNSSQQQQQQRQQQQAEQRTEWSCHGCSACQSAAGARRDPSTEVGNNAALAARLLGVLGSGGSLHHLVPLSLRIAAATEVARVGRPAAAAAAAAVNGLADRSKAQLQAAAATANGKSGLPDTADTIDVQDPAAVTTVFEAMQQLLSVTTVFGSVPVSKAAYWPVYCSASQAQEYAAWWDECNSSSGSSRLPSEAELLLAWQYNDDGTPAAAAAAAAVGGADTAAEYQQSVDFRVWQPVNVQLEPEAYNTNSNTAAGAESDISSTKATNQREHRQQQKQQGQRCAVSQLRDNGWEWSSSVLAEHLGFKPHPLYPEYSVDFFDGKHHVLSGASWATLASIAGRGTFRNFYQAGQQHLFAKFRLCSSQ